MNREPFTPEMTTNEMIDELEQDEAEDIFCAEVDPDGPFRYTGEFDGWWDGLKLIASEGGKHERRIREALMEEGPTDQPSGGRE